MSWEERISRGTIALVKADYVTAEREFKNALALAEAPSATKDGRLNRTMSLLGQTYFKLGNNVQAQSYLQTALKVRDADSLRLAVDYLTLSRISSLNGAPSDERSHFGQAVKFLESTKFSSQSSFAAIRGLEAILLKARKRELQKTDEQFRGLLEQAKRKYQEKIECDQSYFGTEPDAMVDAWQSLMDTSTRLAKRNVADDLVNAYRNSNSALRIALSIFPKDHPNIADSITQLATVCSKLGLDVEADELFNEAYRIAISNHVDPLQGAAIKVSRAHFHARLDDYGSALDCLGAAIEIIQVELPGGTEFGDILDDFAILVQKSEIFSGARDLIKQGIEHEEEERLADAVSCYDSSILLLEKILGKNNLEIAQILSFKANVLLKMNNPEEAEIVQKRADRIEDSLTTRSQNLEKLKAKLPAIRCTI